MKAALKKQYVLFGILAATILGLASSGSHPVQGSAGYTGAPGDAACTNCHTGSNPNLDGDVSIDGLPSTILTNTTYRVTVTVTNPNSNAVRAGFQMVVLNGNNQNSGDLSNNSPQTILKTVSGGKKYFGHQPASNFPASNTLSWEVDWTSPATATTGEVKFYAVGLIANGASGNSNDRTVFTNLILPIQSPVIPLAANISGLVNPTCADSDDGRATVNISGGTPPYNIQWNNGETTATATQLSGGNISVTITDASSNNINTSASLTAPPPLSVNTSSQNVSCNGLSDGSASAQASGGTGALVYQWSNGATGPIIQNVAAGSYTVTVIDVNGCTITAQEVIEQPTPLQVITNSIVQPSCFGASDGEISVTGTGGNGGYSYLWSNGSDENILTDIPAGTYRITITDAQDCSVVQNITLSQPQSIQISLAQLVPVSCFGLNNGSAQLTAQGGTGNKTFTWNDGVVSSFRNQLSAGNYQITATDQNGCVSAPFNVQIQQPAALQTAFEVLEPIACFGDSTGTLNLMTSGGTGPYTYVWSNGRTTNPVYQLTASVYRVSVTDNNGCIRTDSFNLQQPPAIVADTLVYTDTVCFASGNGFILTGYTGGTGTLRYQWSTGDTLSGIDQLSAGAYALTVTDGNHCVSSRDFVIASTTPVNISADIQNTSELDSNDGSISLTLSGGVEPYQIAWSNGQNGIIIDSLPQGTYIVTITDAFGCSYQKSFLVNSDACLLSVRYEIADATCYGGNDGMLDVAVENASGPYLIFLTKGSLSLPDSVWGNLSAGTYILSVTDSIGCILADTVVIGEGSPFEVNAMIDLPDNGEKNGEINVSVQGAGGNYTYIWRNASLAVISTMQDLVNVGKGQYTLQITDQEGCDTTVVFQVDETSKTDDSEPAEFSVFPNPVSGKLFIESPGYYGAITATIFDSRGILVSSQTYTKITVQQDVSEVLQPCHSGMYFLQIDAGGKRKMYKLILP